MKIGVCGTGRMGSAIAQRLMSVGHEVGVWNRNQEKTKPLVDNGAKLFGSPVDLVEGCDVIVVMLLNDAAIDAVYRAPNGILKAKLADKLVIDMSTGYNEISGVGGVSARSWICRVSGRRNCRACKGRKTAWPSWRQQTGCGKGDADT